LCAANPDADEACDRPPIPHPKASSAHFLLVLLVAGRSCTGQTQVATTILRQALPVLNFGV
jgi:hypothetical protein